MFSDFFKFSVSPAHIKRDLLYTLCIKSIIRLTRISYISHLLRNIANTWLRAPAHLPQNEHRLFFVFYGSFFFRFLLLYFVSKFLSAIYYVFSSLFLIFMYLTSQFLYCPFILFILFHYWFVFYLLFLVFIFLFWIIYMNTTVGTCEQIL